MRGRDCAQTRTVIHTRWSTAIRVCMQSSVRCCGQVLGTPLAKTSACIAVYYRIHTSPQTNAAATAYV